MPLSIIRPSMRGPVARFALVLIAVAGLGVPTTSLGEVSAVPVAAVQADAVLGGGIRPVPGDVTRPFDPPDQPWGSGHRGVDLAAETGEQVRAVLDGTVSYVGTINGVGWVTVAHGTRLASTYGDLLPAVARGQAVTAGQVIGTIAEDGVHLDWGARLDGDYLDPLLLLVRWRTHLTAADRVPTGVVIPVS